MRLGQRVLDDLGVFGQLGDVTVGIGHEEDRRSHEQRAAQQPGGDDEQHAVHRTEPHLAANGCVVDRRCEQLGASRGRDGGAVWILHEVPVADSTRAGNHSRLGPEAEP